VSIPRKDKILESLETRGSDACSLCSRRTMDRHIENQDVTKNDVGGTTRRDLESDGSQGGGVPYEGKASVKMNKGDKKQKGNDVPPRHPTRKELKSRGNPCFV